MQDLENSIYNSSYKLPENIVTVIPNCLTKEQCQETDTVSQD